jgi:ribosome-associated protein
MGLTMRASQETKAHRFENTGAHNGAIVPASHLLWQLADPEFAGGTTPARAPCATKPTDHPTFNTPKTPMATLQQITFELRGEHIQLDSLLKACSLVSSGGEAKIVIQGGRVQVDGQDETRRSAKIRAGQVVSLQGARIKVVPQATAPDQTNTELGD